MSRRADRWEAFAQLMLGVAGCAFNAAGASNWAAAAFAGVVLIAVSRLSITCCVLGHRFVPLPLGPGSVLRGRYCTRCCETKLDPPERDLV